ncbi:MAG: S41 family peptidase [Geothrix sp.]|nr:S41 family peptidase [Geothrix sp.]
MPIRPPSAVRRVLAIALWMGAALLAAPPAREPEVGLAHDFDLFCRFVAEDYAYFGTKKTQWDRVCAGYRPGPEQTTGTAVLMASLESALGELYDAHAHLGSSNRNSPRLIPTDAEAWAAWEKNAAIIQEVREPSSASKAGLAAGMRVLAVNGEPIEAAVRRRHPRFLSAPDPEARSWALQSVLAGRQDGQPVRLAVLRDGHPSTIEYVPAPSPAAAALFFRWEKGMLGYIRFNNSLGEVDTVRQFDEALDRLKGSKGLILDLRDTPSGGTSLVARGIMGRLVRKESPYQKHELVAEGRETGIHRRWIECVSPRGEPFMAPLVVLVGRWTGSMGEGLAIGLNAARNAPVIGTPMARMLGALGEIKLPASGIVVRIPTEKLYHVDGTPREAFVPRPPLDSPPGAEGRDRTLRTGLSLLGSVPIEPSP